MGRSKRRALFFALAAAAPLAVACNAIVGLDDYKRTDCGAFPCPFEDGGPDQITPDRIVPDNFVPDATPDAPPGVGPVSWAQFPMPNYKDASTVRPLSYQVIGEEVVDNVTTLVWRAKVVGPGFGTDFTEDEAVQECKKIPGGPWRLPKRIELVTLISYGHPAPAIDTTAFAGFPADEVWSSSEVRPFTTKFWAVNFETGELVQKDRSVGAKVLCVKDKQ